MSGEFERIAEIRRRLGVGGGDAADTLVGNGDDAVVLAASDAPQVISVDTAVEGVHFRRDLLSLEDVGYRALCAALSDLAAMGAEPRAVLVALIAPATLSDAELYAIADGVAEAQRDLGAPVVGGNLALGSELSISTTVIGNGPQAALTRAGARVGDTLHVTGRLGECALGLQASLAGAAARTPDAVERFRRPTPRLSEGRALVGAATACIDISDGLLADLAHLVEASGVGFELELPALPLARSAAVAEELGQDALQLALTGGEDYELLFTAPRGTSLPVPCTTIGHAVERPGVVLRGADGAAVEPPAHAGFDHFRDPDEAR